MKIKGKEAGLSPIQIQILIFIAYHKHDLSNVSHLAKEFNITKPTVIDAIKTLNKKGLILKELSSTDHRRYYLKLTDLGRKTVADIYDFALPLEREIENLSPVELESLFETISKLIYRMNRLGMLTVQRTCFGCRFYEKNDDTDYCHLLQKKLLNREIRLDCPEFEVRQSS